MYHMNSRPTISVTEILIQQLPFNPFSNIPVGLTKKMDSPTGPKLGHTPNYIHILYMMMCKDHTHIHCDDRDREPRGHTRDHQNVTFFLHHRAGRIHYLYEGSLALNKRL